MPLHLTKFDSSNLIEAIMENCEDIVTLRDLNLNYTACNNNFFKFFSIPYKTSINNRSLSDFMQYETAMHVEKRCKLAIAERQTQIYKIKFKVDKGLRVYQVKSSPVIKNDIVTGVLSISRDITDMEQQKILKEEFYEFLLHDMKNSIQAQVKSLSMLTEGLFGELTPRQKDIADLTFEASAELQQLLFSSLSFIKNDMEMTILEYSEFDAVMMIEKCIKEVTSLCYGKNIRIIFNNTLNLPEVMLNADRNKIRRVISNILNNSVKYAFKDTVIEVGLNIKNDNLIFSFKNSSPEIPEDIREHLFEKYVLYTKSFKEFSFGLGLYLSKQIVEKHKGKIYLNAKGTDNEFIFEIPRAKSKLSKVRTE